MRFVNFVDACVVLLLVAICLILAFTTGCSRYTQVAFQRNADGSSIKIVNRRDTLFYDQAESSGFEAGTMSAWRNLSTRGDSVVAVADDLTSAAAPLAEAYAKTQGLP